MVLTPAFPEPPLRVSGGQQIPVFFELPGSKERKVFIKLLFRNQVLVSPKDTAEKMSKKEDKGIKRGWGDENGNNILFLFYKGLEEKVSRFF